MKYLYYIGKHLILITKSITLGELFHILDVTEKLPEAHKIYIGAGKNGTVLFYHDTDCVITYKGKDIPKKKKKYYSMKIKFILHLKIM